MTNLTETFCERIVASTADPPPVYGFAIRSIITAVMFSIQFLCVFGNIIIISAIITDRRLHQSSNVFVLSLAISDISIAIFVMPFQIYQQFKNKVWLLGEKMCIVSICFDVMLCTVSIFNLSCIAFDRYFFICHPFARPLSSGVLGVLLATCWVLPFLLTFLPIMNNVHTIGIENMLACIVPPKNVCMFYVNIEYAYSISIIAFYIPLVFMAICNWKIFQVARNHFKNIINLSTEKAHAIRSHAKAAHTLGVIMGCFGISWFPYFTINLIDPLIGYKISYNVWCVVLWLGYSNSLINPLLFYTFNRKFRYGIRRLFNKYRAEILDYT